MPTDRLTAIKRYGELLTVKPELRQDVERTLGKSDLFFLLVYQLHATVKIGDTAKRRNRTGSLESLYKQFVKILDVRQVSLLLAQSPSRQTPACAEDVIQKSEASLGRSHSGAQSSMKSKTNCTGLRGGGGFALPARTCRHNARNRARECRLTRPGYEAADSTACGPPCL
jgi:hypothetical protein